MLNDSNESRPPRQGDLSYHDGPPPVYGEPVEHVDRPYVAPFGEKVPPDIIKTTTFLSPKHSTWKGVEPVFTVVKEPINVIIPTDVYNNLVKRIEALENRTLVDEHIALVRRVESVEAQVYGDDND